MPANQTPTNPSWYQRSMNKLKQRLGELMMLIGVLLSISGCAAQAPNVRQLQGPGLKPSPLPVAISQIDSSPSKASLDEALEWSKRATQWSDDSKALLSDETQKSPPSSAK